MGVPLWLLSTFVINLIESVSVTVVLSLSPPVSLSDLILRDFHLLISSLSSTRWGRGQDRLDVVNWIVCEDPTPELSQFRSVMKEVYERSRRHYRLLKHGYL